MDDEKIAKILYWTMLTSPTPREVREAFCKEFGVDDWNDITGRGSKNIPCLVWQHSPVPREGESHFNAFEAATWYVTELGIAWLKAYEESQNDTE